MKIGFDGKRAVQNFTGLGNYSRYLIEILNRFYPEHEYRLYAPKAQNSRPFDQLMQRYPQIQLIYASGIWKRVKAVWRSWGITSRLSQDGVEIFHGLSNELPLNIRQAKGVKSVVTLHDLIFLRYPECYKPIDRKIYTYKFRRACEDADAVIAISECTKREIMHFFRIPEEKIHVIYQGCDASFTCPAAEQKKEEVRQRYMLPERYILNVGSIERRKNVLLAVQALEGVADNVHLVIVGRATPYTEQIKSYIATHHLANRVHILHNVSFDDLPAVYQLADLFVYPSRFEGFGIPIIEALHSGIPVVAATGSCLEEAGGPHSLYVDPDDAEGMRDAINQILNNTELWLRMVQAGKEYVQRFSEKIQAQEVMNLYKSLIESSKNKTI